MNTRNRLFLLIGLSLLLVSIVIRWLGVSVAIWGTIFGTAILLKSIFLFNVFRTKGFKKNIGLTLIVIGVGMILTSLIFKYIFPVDLLRNILFYGAIVCKVFGLILMFVKRIGLIK